MDEVCTDGRFEQIARFKEKLVEDTNIKDSPDEMAVLDNILFRMWQMGWLDKIAAPRWVRCEERLPRYGEDVLAARLYGDGEMFYEVIVAHLCSTRFGETVWNATNITHWMPLPEPPKEGE